MTQRTYIGATPPTDDQVAIAAVAFARRLERDGATPREIADTLAGVAITVNLNLRGAATTAAWLRALADAVESEGCAAGKH